MKSVGVNKFIAKHTYGV